MGFWGYTICSVVIAFLAYPYLGGGPPLMVQPMNPTAPARLPHNVTRKVLVVGGGFGGLAAAQELAEKGFEVTVRERRTFLGGHYGSYSFRTLGEDFTLSTGIHTCFHNYHNFKRILKSLDVEKYYTSWQDNHFAFRDYEWENIYSSGPWPLNLIAMILRSPNLSLWTAMKNWRVSLDFIMYDHDTVYERYDHLTFDEWAEQCGVVPAFGDIWLKPGVSASFNNISTFSAAEFLMFSHFFFISSPEAEHREYSTVDSGTSLIVPWVMKLKDLGVKFELGKAVAALGFDPDSGKVTHDISNPSEEYDHVVLAVDLGSAKEILSQSRELMTGRAKAEKTLSRVLSDLGHLPMAQPFKVLKLWFDKRLQRGQNYPLLQTPQHGPVNFVVQLHQVEEQYRAWAEKTGGSVMEFHLYSWSHGEVDDDRVWSVISPAVREIYPEIAEDDFKILASHVASGRDIASFASGTAKYRPRATFPAECGIPNLGLAGSWLRTDYPSALAERAVSTGIEAANQVLLDEGVRQVAFTVTTSNGPGVI